VFGLQLLVILQKASSNSGGGVFGGFGFGLQFFLGVPAFLPDVFAAAWIGMLVGLKAKKIALAPGLTLFYAIVLPSMLICVPNLFLDIPVIFWARDKLYRELRNLAGAGY
jgi:hypothetical protein